MSHKTTLTALWDETRTTTINPQGSMPTFGGLRFPPYDPVSSLTYLYFPLMHYFFGLLASDQFQSPLVARQMEDKGITKTDMLRTYEAYLNMHNLFIGPDKTGTLDEAAIKSGYADCPDDHKLILEAAFSRVVLSAFFSMFRKAVPMGEKPHPALGYPYIEGMMYETLKALDGVETEHAKQVKDSRDGKKTD